MNVVANQSNVPFTKPNLSLIESRFMDPIPLFMYYVAETERGCMKINENEQVDDHNRFNGPMMPEQRGSLYHAGTYLADEDEVEIQSSQNHANNANTKKLHATEVDNKLNDSS